MCEACSWSVNLLGLGPDAPWKISPSWPTDHHHPLLNVHCRSQALVFVLFYFSIVCSFDTFHPLPLDYFTKSMCVPNLKATVPLRLSLEQINSDICVTLQKLKKNCFAQNDRPVPTGGGDSKAWCRREHRNSSPSIDLSSRYLLSALYYAHAARFLTVPLRISSSGLAYSNSRDFPAVVAYINNSFTTFQSWFYSADKSSSMAQSLTTSYQVMSQSWFLLWVLLTWVL